MLYTKEMIKNLGYDSVEEFVLDFVNKHKNCCIRYMDNGVYLDYDFDTDCCNQSGMDISKVIKLNENTKKFPIYYCKCCKKCIYRNKEMKSLFDDKYLVNCADINGLSITPIIPNVFYIIDWCKIRRE